MSLVRYDGSVRTHRALLDPATRFQIAGMDQSRVLMTVVAVLIGDFACLYSAVLTVDTTFWACGAGLWTLCCIAYLVFLRRIGSRGGYYQGMYGRRVREQEAYRRSAHPSAPIRKMPDHAEA
jgi:hypothetical protein